MFYKNLYYEIQKGDNLSNIKFIFLHGWGHSLENLKFISNELYKYDRYLLDLPGFGKSVDPDFVFDLNNYVDLVIDFLKNNFSKKDEIYIIGHSFGGRIAIKLASKYNFCIKKVFIIAGAGLKIKKTFKNCFFSFIFRFIKVGFTFLKYLFKFMKKDITKFYLYKKIYDSLASDDYKSSSLVMKEILKKVVKEDLSLSAILIKLPVILIYGQNDVITPSYFGIIYNKLIKNSKLYILPIFDHNSILIDGRYQVGSIILNNIEG